VVALVGAREDTERLNDRRGTGGCLLGELSSGI
jgi:hypothetical protein